MTDAAETRPEEPSRGRGARFWVLTIIIAVAIIVAGVLIYQASMAAFTAQTGTGSSSFSTGTIDLTNDSEGSAVFTETDLTPGDTGTSDIVVNYTGGTIDSEVRLYSEGSGAAQDLADHIQLTITSAGQPANPAEWTGTLADLQAITDFSQGILPVVLADGQSQTYTVAYEVLDTAPQGAAADVTFVWEAQSQ
ncbi:hypothetical protein Microterr_27160 [Microbacterium terricola]|uniref:Camelysin metallo-endopeptidase n=2 Tax=Microbacterium terricola TaxID=344163 RepID=A0ABM8E2R1_9MICO|nr:hypothetical protein Microterr_27160 [Microbacterium terricola]